MTKEQMIYESFVLGEDVSNIADVWEISVEEVEMIVTKQKSAKLKVENEVVPGFVIKF